MIDPRHGDVAGEPETGQRNVASDDEATDPSAAAGQTVGPSLSRLADARRGILWMLLAMLIAVSMDTLNKGLTQTFPVAQLVWARFLFHVLFLVLLLGRRLPRVMVSRGLGIQVLRAILVVSASMLFTNALRLLPLADATAVLFVAPILVAVLSAPLLGERVDRGRWIGVVLGFAGALIIIRPGLGVMQLATLSPLGAACLFALFQIVTKRVSRIDPPITTLFYTGLVGVLAMSFVVPFFWVAPQAEQWLYLATLGALSGCVHFGMIKAFEAAPAATVAPFVYCNLIWATINGFIFFGDLPDGWTVVGAAIIVGSGLYIARQERGQRSRATPGP